MTTSFDTVFKKTGYVRYCLEPGVSLIAQTRFEPSGIKGFLDGYEEEFKAYHDDVVDAIHNKVVSDGGALGMFAGQLCYLSLGPKRTKHKDKDKYFKNAVLEQKHGSIIEHANYSMLFYGIDRAVTHEKVRHRVAGYSQVSQRYVGLDRIRFCMPFDIQGQPKLVEEALKAMEADYYRYSKWIELYKEVLPQTPGEERTEYRKRLQSASRRVLPNWVEAPIVVTANARSWRHMIEMRAAPSADVAIRRPFIKAVKILQQVAPEFFGDYMISKHKDGSEIATTEYRKV